MNVPQNLHVVNLLAPAADAGGRTSAVYVSLKNAVKAWIVAYITQGNAATIAIAPKQATAVAGTGTKVLANVVPIFANLDVSASDALAIATAAVNYTTDAGVANKIVVFEIDPAQLDLANGFDCIGLTTGASNAANITSALVLIQPNYAGNNPVSYIAD